jgi:subtilase family serine protease
VEPEAGAEAVGPEAEDEVVAGGGGAVAGRGVAVERGDEPQERQAIDAEAMQRAPHSRLGFRGHAATGRSLAHRLETQAAGSISPNRMNFGRGCERMPAARAWAWEAPAGGARALSKISTERWGMFPRRLPQGLVRALAGSAAVLGGLACTGTAAAAPGRAAIAGTHPRWAVNAPGKSAPSVTSGAVNLRVYLAGQDPAGLASYAKSVSDPGSATYGHYLSAAQVQSRFGATAAQVQAVKNWLTGAGLTVTNTTSGIGGYVAVTGTVPEAAKAFGVSFADYTDPSGTTARAPQQAATVPNSLAGAVLAVSGLDTGSHFMRPQDKLPPPGPNYWVAPPTSDFYGQNIATNEPTAGGAHWPWNVTGYTPQQIRGAYGVSGSGMTGSGQTVAIVDAYASPTMLGDANQFSQVTGNQPFQPGQYQQFLSKKWTYTSASECGAAGWYGEETLDVESVHDMAPNANVHYVGAASCTDQDLANADAEIVNQHLASIVSNSWGEPADVATITSVFDQIFQAGAAEGIGFFFSSGDSGYEDPAVEDPSSDKIQVDYPTSSPWVTSVGGTSVAIGASNNYQWETSWGTLNDPLAASGTAWTYTPPAPYGAATYDGSSGGGVSTAYTQPSYQQRVVPQSLATAGPQGTTSTPMRVVPDVSALADPSTGMLVGQTTLQPDGRTYAFSLSRIGGTSVASPTFAGIQADAQQAAGYALGFANPAIYARYGTSAFHDVTDHPLGSGVQLYEVRNNYTDPYTAAGPLVTNLRELGVDGGGAAALPATTGYDDSTGVGSPNRYIQSFGGQGHHRR